jgi:GT2 family glycosyltransferase
MNDPRVSAIIVNWNHGGFLKGCLDALLAEPYPAFDVTVVDNGSTDRSPEWIRHNYPDVRLMRFADNLGFSRAFNLGVRANPHSPLLLSLNPDVAVRPGFLSEMVRAIGQDQHNGTAAPKLLRAHNPALLDSTGLWIDRRRRPFDRGQGEVDRGQYDKPLPGAPYPLTFGACGAAALYRRTMLDDVAVNGEYLDEAFFAYCEDADLAWRAQLRGWRCVYVPQAVATHVRGSGDTLRKRGHAHWGRARKESRGPRLALRNRYLMTVKNDTWPHFLADCPLILAAELPRLAYAAVTMPAVLLGLFDLARAWPLALRKRRILLSRKTVDDAALRCWFVAPKVAAR